MSLPLITGPGTRLAAQKITREEKEDLLAAAQEEYADEVERLCEQLANGEITAEEWMEAMQQHVKDANVSAYLAGKSGDWQSMSFEDWGRLGAVLAGQYAFLRSFRRALREYLGEDARKSLAQMKERARLYAESARQSYQRGYMSELGMDPALLPAYPGDGTTECLVRCRCRWAIRILSVAEGNFDASWKLGNAEHCETCRKRARAWKKLRIRGGQLVDGYESIYANH